jgi:orotidine-5'-phosphate decarboxylase
MLPNTFFLVPGYGAQGGTGKDLQGLYNNEGLGIIVNSSRGIASAYQLEPYKTRFAEKDFAAAAREAALAMRKDILENK